MEEIQNKILAAEKKIAETEENLNKTNHGDLLSIDFPDLTKGRNAMGDLAQYFSESIEYGLQQLGRVGQNSVRKTIRASGTQWSKKRFAGFAKGISFPPYGRSDGREDTGLMYDEVNYQWKNAPGYQNLEIGWFLAEDYFWWQEYGFTSKTYFRHANKGIPSFGQSKRQYKVKGMFSLSKAGKLIERLSPSFVSGAWNEATRKLASKGGTF